MCALSIFAVGLLALRMSYSSKWPLDVPTTNVQPSTW